MKKIDIKQHDVHGLKDYLNLIHSFTGFQGIQLRVCKLIKQSVYSSSNQKYFVVYIPYFPNQKPGPLFLKSTCQTRPLNETGLYSSTSCSAHLRMSTRSRLRYAMPCLFFTLYICQLHGQINVGVASPGLYSRPGLYFINRAATPGFKTRSGL